MKLTFLIATLILTFSMFAGAAMHQRKKTTMIVVHHSESTHGNVDEIRRWHLERKDEGFDDIGYHYVITNGNGGPDGEIQKGREESLAGAHAKCSGPNRNEFSVGICLVGTDSFTEKQKASLIEKLAELCIKYNLDPSATTIQPHHDKCPGDHLDLANIIFEVQARMPAK